MRPFSQDILQTCKKYAQPLKDSLPLLIDALGEASLVLLGEATHGTHEFYALRATITKELIQKKGFTLIAIEGDWPDAYRVHRFIRQQGLDRNAKAALSDFKRFPSWMWRNEDIVELITWLHSYNKQIQGNKPLVGFYGLDLYSLHRSMQAVIGFLEERDPQAAQRARERYACFDAFGKDPQAYGYLVAHYRTPSCQDEALAQLEELLHMHYKDVQAAGMIAEDELFYAQQNALVVKNAEEYYRSIFQATDNESWNIRDEHMMETVNALIAHYTEQGLPSKMIIWAHNSHLGDARATQMGYQGQLNLGQLARERYGQKAALVGFTTYTGTVSAAQFWNGAVQRRHVRKALKESYEELFHRAELDEFWLNIRDNPELKASLSVEKLERAIGVIYAPQTERQSHYFYANLAEQFDFLIHIDSTSAVEPLERTSIWDEGELPETFPSGQ